MKKLRSISLSAVACMLLFCSCKKTNDADSLHKTIALEACTSIENGFPIICYDSLIAESRCPANAICVWEGYAAVKLSMKNDVGGVQPFVLATKTFGSRPAPTNDTTINGYHIKLVDVSPYPQSPGPQQVVLEITH